MNLINKKLINIRNSIGNPGNNFFCKDNVMFGVDNSIVLMQNGFSAEFSINKDLGYGRYEIEFEKPWVMNKNIVFGFFLYADDENEVDIEFSRWGKWYNYNMWLTNQSPHQTFKWWHFQTKINAALTWKEDYIETEVNGIIRRFEKKLPTNTKLIVNLWKYSGEVDNSTMIRITSLKFFPDDVTII